MKMTRIIYVLLLITALLVGFTMDRTPLNITLIVASIVISVLGLYRTKRLKR